jgi:hypothetical protein
MESCPAKSLNISGLEKRSTIRLLKILGKTTITISQASYLTLLHSYICGGQRNLVVYQEKSNKPKMNYCISSTKTMMEVTWKPSEKKRSNWMIFFKVKKSGGDKDPELYG